MINSTRIIIRRRCCDVHLTWNIAVCMHDDAAGGHMFAALTKLRVNTTQSSPTIFFDTSRSIIRHHAATVQDVSQMLHRPIMTDPIL